MNQDQEAIIFDEGPCPKCKEPYEVRFKMGRGKITMAVALKPDGVVRTTGIGPIWIPTCRCAEKWITEKAQLTQDSLKAHEEFHEGIDDFLEGLQ